MRGNNGVGGIIMQKNAPIGVLDSGVGGLSVLKCLQAALPQEDFIYVGDTARTPYGPRSEAEVRRFVGEIIDYLDGRQHADCSGCGHT